MRHTGGTQAGRWAGVQTLRVSFPASQRGGGGVEGVDKKPSDVTAPRSLSLGARPVAARGIGFLIAPVWTYLGTEPAGRGQFHAWARGDEGGRRGKKISAVAGNPVCPSSLETGQQRQNMERKLSRVNGSLAEERHRGSTGSQDRGRRKNTDEPPFPVRPSGVI